MKKVIIVAFSVLLPFTMINISFAADKNAVKQKSVSAPIDDSKSSVPAAENNSAAKKTAVTKKDTAVGKMTVSEISDDISDILDDQEEIMNYIPGLGKEKDESGKMIYTYKGKKLADVERKTLEKVYNRVHQERTRIRTEQINHQLETIRRSQQINAAAANAAMRSVPSVPRIQSLPTVPSSGKLPQAPRVPAPPPSAPKR